MEKIWIYITPDTKRIYMHPIEDIDLRCLHLTRSEFRQVIRDGYIHYAMRDPLTWFLKKPVKYEMNPFQRKLQLKKIEAQEKSEEEAMHKKHLEHIKAGE